MEGVDLASPLSVASVARLRLAGKKFVARYLAPPGAVYDWKRLRRSEVLALRAARMGLVCVWESGARRALDGHTAGVADARAAAALLKELGIPNAPVYFAVDFDASPGEQGAINLYLRGAGVVLGKNRVGIYGGFWPVKRALDAGVCKYGWQTYAWSGGNRDTRAQLYQHRNGQRVAGLSVDLDRTYHADYGNALAKAAPTPKPAPAPKRPSVAHGHSVTDGAYIYIRDKDGSIHYEHLTARGAMVRFEDWKAGKYQELRFKRA